MRLRRGGNNTSLTDFPGLSFNNTLKTGEHGDVQGCSRLERHAGKLARGVPRGEGFREGPDLLDFLQNIWNHVEVKDCGLHQQLSKGIKHLHLVSAPKQAMVEVAGRGKLPLREVFKKVERELRGLVKARNKKLERLRGVASYEAVQAYTGKLDAAFAPGRGEGKGFELLQATAEALRALLESTTGTYEDCKALNARFQEIRRWIGKDCPSKGSS